MSEIAPPVVASALLAVTASAPKIREDRRPALSGNLGGLGGHLRDIERLCRQLSGHLDTVQDTVEGADGAGVELRIGLAAEIARDIMARVAVSRCVAGRAVQDLTKLDADLAQLRQEAHRDPLTGTLNRRALEVLLPPLLQSAALRSRVVLMVMLDIDHFKSVNDRFGHPVGDMVLRDAARHLMVSVRDEDLVARLGGEEFAVVLTGASAEGARDLVERLRVLSVLVPGHGALPVRFSAGMAAWTPGQPVPRWMSRADDALYRAKRGGRNRVETDEMVTDADVRG